MDGSTAAEDGRLRVERAPGECARVLLEINNAIVSHLDLAHAIAVENALNFEKASTAPSLSND
jgi:hypothetical protein